MTSPVLLEEFFSSGFEESTNPFIKHSSRGWGRYAKLASSLSALVFLIAAYFTSSYSFYLSSFFLVFVYFLAGTEALIESIRDAIRLNINIDVLMTLAALLSVAIGSQLEGGLLLVLFSLSESLEDLVTKKTKGALSALHKLTPTNAWIIEEGGHIFPKSVREISQGTLIFVKVGDVIPLDGIVENGSSYVNLMHLTGESLPVSKQKGDEVQAGSINTDGQLTIRVTRTMNESTLAKIIRLVTEAQESKPRVQRFLDRFGRGYATTVILLSVLLAAVLPLLFSHISYLGIEGSIYRSLAFLIAASPCALIIATPTAYLSAISSAARKGVLLKGGTVLDALAGCNVCAFDKTGTLTTGKLFLRSVENFTGQFSDMEVLEIAASLEKGAHHPIAGAICAAALRHKLGHHELSSHQVIPGKGVQGSLQFKDTMVNVTIGSLQLVTEVAEDAEVKKSLAALKDTGHIVAFVLINNALTLIRFDDELRPAIRETIDRLKKLGVRPIMLTGDNEESGRIVAAELHIDDYRAGLKPEDKLRIIKELSHKESLAMIGDGINDSPALTAAHVGIAMGQIGSDSAIEASDIVLLRDEITIIGWLFKKARSTARIVKQNLSLALFVILFATTFSIAGIIPLWLAVILHEGSTVIVGLNSLRLLQK